MVKNSGHVLLKTLVTEKMHPFGCYTHHINENIISIFSQILILAYQHQYLDFYIFKLIKNGAKFIAR